MTESAKYPSDRFTFISKTVQEVDTKRIRESVRHSADSNLQHVLQIHQRPATTWVDPLPAGQIVAEPP